VNRIQCDNETKKYHICFQGNKPATILCISYKQIIWITKIATYRN